MAGLVVGIDLEGEDHLLFPALDGDLDGLALVGAEGAIPAGEVGDGVCADLEDYVFGLKAGGGSLAFAGDLLDHEAGGDAEEVGCLGGERLDECADIERAAKDGEAQGAGNAGIAFAVEDAHGAGRLGEVVLALADAGPDFTIEDAAIDELDGEGLDVAVAADFEADFAAGGNFAQHAVELLGAFDVLAVELDDDVVDVEADLAGGRVVVDEGDDGAADFLELEGLGFFLIDVGEVNAEIALRC